MIGFSISGLINRVITKKGNYPSFTVHRVCSPTNYLDVYLYLIPSYPMTSIQNYKPYRGFIGKSKDYTLTLL